MFLISNDIGTFGTRLETRTKKSILHASQWFFFFTKTNGVNNITFIWDYR